MGTRLSSDCSRGGQSARSQLAGAGPEAALACAALVEADGFELLETVAFGGDFRAAAIRAALVPLRLARLASRDRTSEMRASGAGETTLSRGASSRGGTNLLDARFRARGFDRRRGRRGR